MMQTDRETSETSRLAACSRRSDGIVSVRSEVSDRGNRLVIPVASKTALSCHSNRYDRDRVAVRLQRSG
jgi:hypothetical protein